MTLYNALPLKNCKIDLLTQEYEKFSISNEETIDSSFTRFNAIVTSLKLLDPDYSSKNHVMAIEEAKDLATLPLDELIGNLKLKSLGRKLVLIEIVNEEVTKTLMKKKPRHSIYWLGTSQ
ncbi:hypothetical protein Tco_1414138, partial [Tanacetum coccineum]